MAARLVCTADRSHRSDCSSGCNSCGYLIPDRRSQSVQKLRWSSPDRRVMSHWVPMNPQLAAVGAGAVSAVAMRGAGERTGGDAAGAQLLFMAGLLVAFNLLDSILTARALSMGFTEANPVMAGLFSMSVPIGMLFKTAIVGAGTMMLWKFRHLPVALRGMTAATLLYAAVIVYHLYFQFVVA